MVSVKSAAALSLTSVRPGFTSDFTWSVFGFVIDPDIDLLLSNIHIVLFGNDCKVRSR